MLSIKMQNLQTEAIRYAYKANNWLDDDCLMDACKDAANATNPQDLLDAVSYMLSSITYRRDSTISKVPDEMYMQIDMIRIEIKANIELDHRADRPEYGKQYALTGGNGQPCILNGNSWKDSEVKQ